MGFCYELESGCCSCPVRTTVCTALCHYMIHGIFLLTFGLTNVCYPPLYYVDYVFGGCGGALFAIAFLTALVVDLKKCQWIRCIMSLITLLVVLSTVAASYYYVIMRWNDVMVTAFSHYFKSAAFKNFPDTFWYFLAIMSCIPTPVMLLYLIYIMSFMCNPWKSYLFTSPYQNNRDVSVFTPPLTVRGDVYSSKSYKPYPTQKIEDSQ